MVRHVLVAAMLNIERETRISTMQKEEMMCGGTGICRNVVRGIATCVLNGMIAYTIAWLPLQ